jgi:hypothetical protein
MWLLFFSFFLEGTVDVIVKKKVVGLKCNLEEPCKHNACIASITNLHAKLVRVELMQAQIVPKTLIAHHYKKMCKDQAMSQVQMVMKRHKLVKMMLKFHMGVQQINH